MWLLHKYKSFGRDAGVLFLVQILEALGMHSMGNKSKKKNRLDVAKVKVFQLNVGSTLGLLLIVVRLLAN